MCTPHGYQTNEPKSTKIGIGELDANLTLSAEFDLDRVAVGRATHHPFYVDLGCKTAKLAQREGGEENFSWSWSGSLQKSEF